MGGYQKFRLLDAAFVIGSILTFIADQVTGILKFKCLWGILNPLS